MDFYRDRFVISTDPSRLDLDLIYHYLAEESYWAQGRSMEVTRKSIENSLCFGVYDGQQQVGFARILTDYATFAWLCDVFILSEQRGQGLGKWLVQCIVDYIDQHGIRRVMLATRDAHQLYQDYGGFERIHAPERWMERIKE